LNRPLAKNTNLEAFLY